MSRAFLVVTALAVLPAACGGSKGGTLKDITVTPSNPTTQVGIVTQFMASLNYQGKGPSTKPPVLWSSSNTAVATIDQMGRATPLTVGTTTITAKAGGKMGSTMLTVSAQRVLTRIDLTPATPRVPVRRAIALTATGVYSDQTTANLTSMAEWTSATPAVATVTNTGVKGLVVGVAVGTARITAAVGGMMVSADVMVTNPTLTSLTITPQNVTLARNTTQRYTATATYSDATSLNVTSAVTWTSSMPAVASISNVDDATRGTATALTAGETTITAALDTMMATSRLTVRDVTPMTLVVTPANPTLGRGATQQMTATVTFSDNSTQDVTANASWSSGTVATATVAANGTVTALADGTTVITAMFGGISGMTTVTVTGITVSTITVTPSNASLAKGTTQQYSANAVYSDMSNRDVTDEVTWGSTTETVASVSNAAGSKGLATAANVGETMITASLMGKVGSTALTVTDTTLTALAISPENPTIANTTSIAFEAKGLFNNGTNQDMTNAVTWTSSNPAVASISNADGSKGVATGVAPGFVDITATLGAVSKTTRLTITAATLSSITVTPPLPRLAQGTATQLKATGNFSDGTVQDLTESASWSTTAAAVATVSATAGTRGRLTAVAPGTAQIRAAVGAVQGSATVTVTNATLSSITISPSNPTIARNTTVDLTASGLFSDGTNQDLTVAVSWTSAGSAIASVDSGGATPGRVRGLTAGTAMITATLGAVTGSTTVTVTNATLMSIAVAPASVTIAKTTMTALVATGTFSDNTTQPLTTSVFWASVNPAVATVSNGTGTEGHVTGLVAGTTNITARLLGVTGMSAVTVTNATITSLAVSPTTPSIGVGTTQQFTATGTFSDNTTQNLNLQAVWTSSDITKAVISNALGSKGVATGLAAGMTTITGSFGGQSGNTVLTVNAPTVTLVSVSIDPGAPTVQVGGTTNLTLTGVYSDNSVQTLTEDATWSSSNANATVSTAMGTRGRVTGVTAGTSVITASVSGKTAMVTVTVSAAPLVSITLSPLNDTAPIGTTPNFTATGNYMGAPSRDITAEVTWGSPNPAVATIATGGMNIGEATAVSVGTTTISATLGGITASTMLTVSPATLMSITISPNPIKIAKTTKRQLSAQGTWTDGRTEDVTTTATWGSANTAVATVSNAAGEQGQVLGIAFAMGGTTITATIGAVVGTAPINVTNAVITSMTLDPAGPTVPAGLTQQFNAIGTFVDTTVMPTDTDTQNLNLQATWASSMTSIATISNATGSKGLATTLAQGATTISAVFNGVAGTTTLTVNMANLVSISVTPANRTIAKGTTQQYAATGIYSDNTTQDLTGMVTWASNTPSVATINGAGLATALTPNNTVISATLMGVTGTTILTVSNATIVSMVVRGAPPAAAMDPAVSIAAGTSHQFYAVGTFSDATEQDLTTQVTWASSDLTLATISTTGVGLGVSPGMPSVTAIFRDAVTGGTLAASRALTVSNKTLTSIAITPANPSVAAGINTQLTATATYSDGSTDNRTADVTWAVTMEMPVTMGNTVATIANGPNDGRLTSVSPGTATVTATFMGVTGTTSVTVTAAVLQSIAVTTMAAPALNATMQYIATGTFSDNSMVVITDQVTWASSNTAAASISNAMGTKGLASTTAATGMSTTISAFLNGTLGSTTLTLP